MEWRFSNFLDMIIFTFQDVPKSLPNTCQIKMLRKVVDQSIGGHPIVDTRFSSICPSFVRTCQVCGDPPGIDIWVANSPGAATLHRVYTMVRETVPPQNGFIHHQIYWLKILIGGPPLFDLLRHTGGQDTKNPSLSLVPSSGRGCRRGLQAIY